MSRNPRFGIAEERGSDGEEEPGESASVLSDVADAELADRGARG